MRIVKSKLHDYVKSLRLNMLVKVNEAGVRVNHNNVEVIDFEYEKKHYTLIDTGLGIVIVTENYAEFDILSINDVWSVLNN